MAALSQTACIVTNCRRLPAGGALIRWPGTAPLRASRGRRPARRSACEARPESGGAALLGPAQRGAWGRQSRPAWAVAEPARSPRRSRGLTGKLFCPVSCAFRRNSRHYKCHGRTLHDRLSAQRGTKSSADQARRARPAGTGSLREPEARGAPAGGRRAGSMGSRSARAPGPAGSAGTLRDREVRGARGGAASARLALGVGAWGRELRR